LLRRSTILDLSPDLAYHRTPDLKDGFKTWVKAR
jgi:hypothetical protein